MIPLMAYGQRRIRHADMLIVAIDHNLTSDEARRWCFTRWLVRNGLLADAEPVEVLVRPRRRLDV